tara:strand:- start:232 stop:435 length:204 start_codon:yes stop_codon:yes gene_type:complete
MMGFFVFVGGLAYGAFLLGAPPTYIAVGAVILIGIGLMSATNRTRTRDVSPDAPVGETTTTTTRREI